MNPNGNASTTVSQVVKSVQTGFQVNLTLSRHPEFYIHTKCVNCVYSDICAHCSRGNRSLPFQNTPTPKF